MPIHNNEDLCSYLFIIILRLGRNNGAKAGNKKRKVNVM